ncbi:MAG TPA: DUF3084 domain-containing protein [Patescibacteria group bacterium]|nr:DUF3084 domain-containing protein [Patescibacteria group bacterium]
MYGIALIVILAVMGGAIAYIGDKLGSRIGKKKLSVFGLRPKHTSILMTIITGVMIAAATLGILSMASQDVRTALFGMKAIKEELVSLAQEVAAQNVELDASRVTLAAKNRELADLTAQVGEAAGQLASVTQNLAVAVAERDRIQAALGAMQADYELARQDVARFRTEVAALQEAKQQLDAKVGELSAARDGLQSDVDRLNQQTEALRQGIQNVREGVVVFRAGEILSAAVIEGGHSQEQVTQELNNMLYQTNQGILEKLGIKDKDLEVLWVSRDDFRQAAAKVAESPDNLLIRVVTGGNTVYGEPVIGVLQLYPNRLIYAKDTVIYMETVNLGQDGQQAEALLMMLLQKASADAVRQGVLPDPLKGSVGVMEGAHLFEIVNRMKMTGGRMEITVVAQNDTYTAGPLQVDVRVRKLF